jgi:hypothetical protein
VRGWFGFKLQTGEIRDLIQGFITFGLKARKILFVETE